MIINGNSIPECWIKALRGIVENPGDEILPAVVHLKLSENQPEYQTNLESELNVFLKQVDQPSVSTTANTIFPESLSHGKVSIYERFEKIWPLVKHDTKNRNGHYFRRLMAYDEKSGKPVNQLEHIVDIYKKGTKRRSALIAITFDPTLDHTAQRQRGFPCLQQVCFLPREGGSLSLNAIYAMQYLTDRAYGNYLGLARLGNFMAKEMGLELTEICCIASVLKLGAMTKENAKEFVNKYYN